MLFTFFLARLCYEICPVRWSGNHLIKQGKYSDSPNSLVAMVPFCKYLPTSVSLLDFAKHCRPLHTDTSRGGGRKGYSTNVYTVTSITWPYRGLSCRPIEVECFLKLSADKLPVCQMIAGSSLFFPMIHIKYVVFLSLWPRTIMILISNWPRTRNLSQFFLKIQAGEDLFLPWSRSTSSFYALIGQNLFYLFFILFYYFATHNELQAE